MMLRKFKVKVKKMIWPISLKIINMRLYFFFQFQRLTGYTFISYLDALQVSLLIFICVKIIFYFSDLLSLLSPLRSYFILSIFSLFALKINLIHYIRENIVVPFLQYGLGYNFYRITLCDYDFEEWELRSDFPNGFFGTLLFYGRWFIQEQFRKFYSVLIFIRIIIFNNPLTFACLNFLFSVLLLTNKLLIISFFFSFMLNFTKLIFLVTDRTYGNLKSGINHTFETNIIKIKYTSIMKYWILRDLELRIYFSPQYTSSWKIKNKIKGSSYIQEKMHNKLLPNVNLTRYQKRYYKTHVGYATQKSLTQITKHLQKNNAQEILFEGLPNHYFFASHMDNKVTLQFLTSQNRYELLNYTHKNYLKLSEKNFKNQNLYFTTLQKNMYVINCTEEEYLEFEKQTKIFENHQIYEIFKNQQTEIRSLLTLYVDNIVSNNQDNQDFLFNTINEKYEQILSPEQISIYNKILESPTLYRLPFLYQFLESITIDKSINPFYFVEMVNICNAEINRIKTSHPECVIQGIDGKQNIYTVENAHVSKEAKTKENCLNDMD